MEARAFELSAAQGNLGDVDVVLHCAGPFSTTAPPMIAACLATGRATDRPGWIRAIWSSSTIRDRVPRR